MPVSRETVLYFDPNGGPQTAALKSILVRMGVRIKTSHPTRLDRPSAACSAARDLTHAKIRKPPH